MRQLGAYALTLWAVLTINFFLPRAMPGDPIAALQDPNSATFLVDDTTRDRIAAYYGLDRPLAEQYIRYLRGLVTGNLGWSIRFNAPVAELIVARLPWTLLLTVPSLFLASVITVLAGAVAGWRRGAATDRSLIVGFTLLRAVPVFFLGALALYLFSVRLNWLPLAGATTPFRTWSTPWAQAADIVRHWLLPATLLTLEMIGGRFLLMRNSMVSVVDEDYILVARAKGLTERRILFRHAMRNAMLPFFTAFSAQLGIAIAGTIFIETLFVYPGMGRLMFEAVGARDYPVMEGVFLLVAVSVLTFNLLADLLYVRLDPRVRSA